MGQITKLEKKVRAGEQLATGHVLALIAEIRRLRRLLCMKICETMWVEGCSDFTWMDECIKPYGFRLVPGSKMSSSKDPVLEEIR